jgi:hypothetical protein
LIKKRREECIVLLDDCFDCNSTAQTLIDNGITVHRFTLRFPAAHDPEKREQSVKDKRVIQIANDHGYLLLTSDKSMREMHADDLLQTELAVIASSSNKGDDVADVFARAFVLAKARIMRDFRKLDRPYFCVLHRSGKIEQRPIRPLHQRPSTPGFSKTVPKT